MTYIPQEAKEQIANLMTEVEKLEAEKADTLKKLNDLKKKSSSSVDKANTVKFSLIAIIALLVIAFAFVYFNGSSSGVNAKDKAKQERYVSNLEKENSAYKAKIKALKSKLSAIEKSSKKPDLLYKVQIGAFKSFSLDGYVKENESLIEKNDSGLKKYSLGSFGNYKDALKFKKEVKRLGFRDAFLVVEYKGQKINVREGIKLENR